MNALGNRFFSWFFVPFRPAPADVLHLINQARSAEGRPPLDAIPVGDAGRPNACPLAHAIGGFVGVDGVCFDEPVVAMSVASAWNTRVRRHADGSYVVGLPQLLQRFVRDFDMGAYNALKPVPAA